MPSGTAVQKLIDHVRRKGVIRASELAEKGIPSIDLTRLVREGRLERVSFPKKFAFQK